MDDLIIRPATADDAEFIITCIIEAEGAGTLQSSYEKIFEVSKSELRLVLKNILAEDVPGCELFCPNYFIAIKNNEYAGGAAAWIEGTGNQGSNIIRASLFSYFFGSEKWKSVQEKLKTVAKHEIMRTPGSLQFEDAYVSLAYRGQRIVEQIFKHGVQGYKKNNPSLKIAQGFTLAGNIQSLISMTKMKWKQKRKVMFTNDEVRKLLPGKGKLQWELDLTDPTIISDYRL